MRAGSSPAFGIKIMVILHGNLCNSPFGYNYSFYGHDNLSRVIRDRDDYYPDAVVFRLLISILASK